MEILCDVPPIIAWSKQFQIRVRWGNIYELRAPIVNFFIIIIRIGCHQVCNKNYGGRGCVLINPLTAGAAYLRVFIIQNYSNYSIWIFTHLKLCLADAIHNNKWVKIIQIWQ